MLIRAEINQYMNLTAVQQVADHIVKHHPRWTSVRQIENTAYSLGFASFWDKEDYTLAVLKTLINQTYEENK